MALVFVHCLKASFQHFGISEVDSVPFMNSITKSTLSFQALFKCTSTDKRPCVLICLELAVYDFVNRYELLSCLPNGSSPPNLQAYQTVMSMPIFSFVISKKTFQLKS